MLKNFIEGVKDALPAIAGTIGYAVAGPAGAAIGSGIGSLARGDEGDQALQNALIAGGIGYGGQKFLSGGSGPIGQFFSKGTIPGVVGDTGILKSFSQRSFSPGMTQLGFGGKYLPAETIEASRMIGGTPVYTSGEAGYGTVMSGGTEVSGATLKEFDALKALGTGESDATILAQAKKNVLSGSTIAKDAGTMSKFLEFSKANPELVLGAGLLLERSGFFDEGDIEELPPSPIPGSQGSLNTGIARVAQPVAGQGGLFSYNMAKDGGIMKAKDGKQADEEDSLSAEDRALLDMLRESRERELMESLKNFKFNMDQFQNPKFTPEGVMTIGAAQGRMMDGSISNFKENSPRRDLFLEREGPISDDRGSPNKDTVYAKLADGEFVVNADTVADIGYGMGARNLEDAKDLGGSFFYGLQDAQKKGILGNMVGMA
tara:strand:- start:2590 stop:3882 length:1293 start_codon:yes stop_codon:yes gene_type:complete